MRGFSIKLMSALFIFICTTNNSYAASQEYNIIDGFTSASPLASLEIETGFVYKTFAVIKWKEFYRDSNVYDYKIRWGSDSGTFTDSFNVKRPFTRKVFNTDTLKPLKENTKYYAQFFRDYSHDPEITPFRFNTPPLPTVAPVSITYSRPALHLNTSNSIETMEIYNAMGKRVAKFSGVVRQRTALLSAAKKVPGLYIAYYKDSNNRVISSEKMLVGN